jgi:hypothetical protein
LLRRCKDLRLAVDRFASHGKLAERRARHEVNSRRPLALIAFSFSENLWTLSTAADWLWREHHGQDVTVFLWQ